VTWQINALVTLHWRDWNGEWVVFDVGSGQTHQMDTLTATVLMLLETAPASQFELASLTADALAIPNDHSFSSALSGILDGLRAAGLIESLTK
jgi:PqqD family protein of HPr-rel-A system